MRCEKVWTRENRPLEENAKAAVALMDARQNKNTRDSFERSEALPYRSEEAESRSLLAGNWECGWLVFS